MMLMKNNTKNNLPKEGPTEEEKLYSKWNKVKARSQNGHRYRIIFKSLY